MSSVITGKKRCFEEMQERELKVPTKLCLRLNFDKFSAIILENDFQGRIQLRTAAALEGLKQFFFKSEIPSSKVTFFTKRKGKENMMRPCDTRAISIAFFHQGKERTLVLQNARFFQ